MQEEKSFTNMFLESILQSLPYLKPIYIFVSFIKFLGQLPILVLISFGITYLITQSKSKNKRLYSEESESIIESFKLF